MAIFTFEACYPFLNFTSAAARFSVAALVAKSFMFNPGTCWLTSTFIK